MTVLAWHFVGNRLRDGRLIARHVLDEGWYEESEAYEYLMPRISIHVIKIARNPISH